jgi:hypothetical protein
VLIICLLVKNRSPRAALRMTDSTKLPVCGTPCYVHIPPEKRTGAGSKLHPKATRMILIGYSSIHKAWKLFDMNTLQEVNSCHVMFEDENRPERDEIGHASSLLVRTRPLFDTPMAGVEVGAPLKGPPQVTVPALNAEEVDIDAQRHESDQELLQVFNNDKAPAGTASTGTRSILRIGSIGITISVS